MRWLAILVFCAGCGLPPDVVGRTDYGDYPPDPNMPCPKPEAGSGVVSPCEGR